MTKEIACLANSRKASGRCIAGIERDTSIWIRPVSNRPHEEISEEERRYEDGSMPEVFDVIRFVEKSHKPNLFQTENYLIDDSYYWEKTGRISFDDLQLLADAPPSLWNNLNSSYQGINDRIHSDQVIDLSNSLYLIHCQESKILVRTEGAEFGNGKRKVRIEFDYNGQTHRLPVTDPVAEGRYLGMINGEYPIIDSHYICVSLGLPHTDGQCYIFVATLFVA